MGACCELSASKILLPRCPIHRLDFALESEVIMSVRASMVLLLLSLLLGPQAQAKNKKKQQLLPDQVLKAKTVLIVIHPEMAEPLTNSEGCTERTAS